MSAVIWFGIVAVWAFVLIPTWVRRSDLHWRRTGDPSTTRSPLGRAARVISRSGSTPRQTTSVPQARRAPAAGTTTTRRTVVAAAGTSATGTAPSVTARRVTTTVATDTLIDDRTESLTGTPTDDLPATETAPSDRGPTAAEPEAPMTTPTSPRPVHRRTSPGARRKPSPPPHVQRARRLVWIGATALATLLLALIMGGMWVLIHLVADVALVGYLRHLRGIAVRQQEARRARRAATVRGEGAREAAPAARAAAPAPRAARRIAEVRARVEENRVRVPAGPQAPDTSDEADVAGSPAVSASAPTARTRTRPAPHVIDLTDGALGDDCPTTELMSARAV